MGVWPSFRVRWPMRGARWPDGRGPMEPSGCDGGFEQAAIRREQTRVRIRIPPGDCQIAKSLTDPVAVHVDRRWRLSGVHGGDEHEACGTEA